MIDRGLNRDIKGGPERKLRVSIAGGFIRFDNSGGDAFTDADNTIEGNASVLDGDWAAEEFAISIRTRYNHV